MTRTTYKVATTTLNYSTIGVWENDNIRHSMAFTPIDFYNLFDKLVKFFGKAPIYKKPKLYPTKYDVTTCGYAEIKETWGNKWEILLIPNDLHNDCMKSYGVYTKDELLNMFNAMYVFVKSNHCDPIFNQQSSHIFNIGYNPYSIYKDVYPQSKITFEIMFFLILIGEWFYQSKTLQENLDFIRNKYKDNFDDVLNDVRYQHLVKKYTIQNMKQALCFINTYKSF